METRIPVELNWVEKRAACTVATVFNQLCDGIEADVASFNAVCRCSEVDRFVADRPQGGPRLVVAQPHRMPRLRVQVEASADNRIVVSNEWETWDARLGLNNEGRCVLRLKDETELEQWQFRKKALEGLFFGDKA